MVAQMICEKWNPEKKTEFQEERKGVLKPFELSEEELSDLIKKNPDYSVVICRCEHVTEGEIREAIRRPLGAKTVDGVKRRTRAGMGRCQAGFCTPKVMEILAEELGISMLDVTKNGGASKMLTGEIKEEL
jgi:glycerol-3-phosphate dehydrogenase